MPEFSEEEQKILSPFFTNMDSHVFALRNLPEVVKGALFSRYSRSPNSLRRILLEEFINKPEMGFKDIVCPQEDNQIVATRKAEKFYDRILVGYGDDSVAELGGAHIAVEDISIIATKVLEDSRIGLSPLEKSTRYVLFNEKVDGKYRYYREPQIMQSAEFRDLYVKTCDTLFDVYTELIKPLNVYLTKKFPRDPDVSERAYENTIKAKTCDLLRNLLPASTLTNVGLFGNGRAFEYLLMKMSADHLTEIRHLAEKMQHELSKIVPSFVKRVYNEHGEDFRKFIKNTETEIKTIPVKVDNDLNKKHYDLELVYYDEDAIDKIVTFILYEQTGKPLSDIKEAVEKMPLLQKSDIIGAYLKKRNNRRHKPGRAFENVSYTFDILANFGAFRDLQRHRILTQLKQPLTTDYGYDIPGEITDAGLADDYVIAMEKAKEAFEKMREKFPKEAQYVVPLGYKIRWYFTLNLRELYHLCELRSGRQGHIDYRRVAQDMYVLVKAVHPLLVKYMNFIDLQDYDLERLDAEKRIDKKIEILKKKWGE